MSEPKFHPDMVVELIERLNGVYWNSPIKVEITSMSACYEKLAEGRAATACTRLFSKDANILLQIIDEIHADLEFTERKCSKITNYRIAFYTIATYDNDPRYFIRYAKNSYKA